MVIGNLDMTAIPHWKDGIIIIVPLLCLVTSLASTLVSTMIQKKNNPAAAQQTSQMLIMMLMMPFFSFYISFKVPAAVGFTGSSPTWWPFCSSFSWPSSSRRSAARPD